MGYSQRFVLCILVNGVPQKELANGECHIPFNSQYSIRLRNRNNRAAAVQIYIDGENVSGEGYKVPANDKVDIHRYAEKDVTFKFVDLESPDAVEYGKNGPNPDKVKGTIEARFYLEKEKPTPAKVEHHHHHYPQPYPVDPYGPWKYPYRHRPYSHRCLKLYDDAPGAECKSLTSFDGVISTNSSLHGSSTPVEERWHPPTADEDTWIPIRPKESHDLVREGATVEGTVSGQRFHKVTMDLEDSYVSVKVFLKGYDAKPAKVEVVVPQESVNVPQTPAKFCTSCGTSIQQGNKFCGNCGVKLV